MLPTKIVVIGAGSVEFGVSILSTLLRSERLKGSQVALVDRNEETLQLVYRLAERLNRAWDANCTISCHVHHRQALAGAEFVVLSIEVPPRERLWKQDFEIPLKYGVRQPYAENGGPGGFVHALRNLVPVMEIVRDMEDLCPDAWLINFTNPMMRICDAVARYSRIRVVGLCHQFQVGYAMVGLALARDLDIHVPPGFTDTRTSPASMEARRVVARQAMEKVHICAAGLNHFTWMLSLHDRRTGEDLYPLFARRWRDLPASFEPLTRRVFDAFGLFPMPGDEHLSEYLPWVSDPTTRPWEKYDLDLYEWDLFDNLRHTRLARIAAMAEGKEDIEPLRDVESEGAAEVIQAIAGSELITYPAVNIPNRGHITNLPEGAIVEVPGVISGMGVHGIGVGSLPDPIAELLRREITVVRLTVDAAVHGDRQAALQALLLDPVVRDMDVARQILEDYLNTYREYLSPLFAEE